MREKGDVEWWGQGDIPCAGATCEAERGVRITKLLVPTANPLREGRQESAKDTKKNL